MMLNALYFWFFGTLAAVCGLGVVLSRHPMHSAISLIGTMLAIAALFLQLHSEFLAYAQVIVYTGAVMVLIVFTISLLNLRQSAGNPMCPSRWWGVGFVGLFLLVFCIYQLIDKSYGFAGPGRPSVSASYGEVPIVAHSLFTTYLFPFEFVAVLLTVAVVGATVLARRDPETHPMEQEEQK